MTTKIKLTPDDLWRMGNADDIQRELVDGEIVEMAPAGGVHGKYMLGIGRILADFVERENLGEVVVGDVGFVLGLASDPGRVRAPDVAFISKARIGEEGISDRFIQGPPDLAVEILSPSESPVEIQQKVQDYLDAGTRLVWVLAPKAKSITAYHPDGSARLVRAHEILDGEDVLPGLKIPLADLFR